MNTKTTRDYLAQAIIALMIALLAATPAHAANKKQSKAKAKQQQTQKAEKAAAPEQEKLPANLNPIAKTFADKGATKCAGRIDQVTNFLSNGATSGAFVFVPPSQPNKNISSVSMEMVVPNQTSAYASASFAPGQANGCAATYDAVAWWPMKCDAVAKQQFPGKPIGNALKQNIAVLELNAATRVFLMPTGDGCVSIKKEVIL